VAGRFYVDSSAYLCLLLGEEGSAELVDRLAGGQLLSSVLLVLETNRNLVRLAREGSLPVERLKECLDRVLVDTERFLLRDLTLDLCSGWALPVVSTPRSLDLAHLRTALWFHEREALAAFVTLDLSQRQAAHELGLPA
jgi:hypothetical protein